MLNSFSIASDVSAGAVTEFTAGITPNRFPQGITLGPDDNLWFTESNPSKIGRITPSGQITQFPLSDHSSAPSGITAGPDGNLWFTESRARKIARIAPGQIGIDVKQAGTRVKRSRARFRLACAGSSAAGICTGVVRLSLRRHAASDLTRLAAAHYRLRSGRHGLISLRLDRRARSLLTRAQNRGLDVIVSATVRGGYATSRPVVLHPPT